MVIEPQGCVNIQVALTLRTTRMARMAESNSNIHKGGKFKPGHPGFNRSHGMYRSPEYTAWARMKYRCSKPTHKAYSDYGGRGISVYPEWQKSFEAFYAYIGPPTLVRDLHPYTALTDIRITTETMSLETCGGLFPANSSGISA
jgi:hypothetical protein